MTHRKTTVSQSNHAMGRRILSGVTFVFGFYLLGSSASVADDYIGQLDYDVKRDRIIAISEDYSSLYYYVGPANIDYTNRPGATCPDPTTGWKTGMKYCWGGEDTPLQYLDKIAAGLGAGNKNTGGTTSFDTYAAGADCSGMASTVWTSPRRATSGFGSISTAVGWENLRMGDATNYAGSHIRIYDYYVSNAGTLMFYETTSGNGLLWKSVHRALARDNNYVPLRYRNPSGFEVYDFPEPVITYVKTTGVERVEVRWDGQASVGFRLYRSLDGANWELIRDAADLLPTSRICEVSGLLPDTTYYFRATSVNASGETAPSAVAAWRLHGPGPAVLLVDGADRYREQTGSNHTFMTRVGAALGQCGLDFDFCANESVVDGAIALGDYDAVVWILAEESTFDETFSWPEQKR
ncbi:MAG: fibronectin type III domain-containing protein, partial [bacterium]